MEKRFSIYEAKAKFSELVRHVLQNGSAVVTQRGLPVVRLVVYQPVVAELSDRLEQLQSVGKARKPQERFTQLLRQHRGATVKPGAVERFLKDRD